MPTFTYPTLSVFPATIDFGLVANTQTDTSPLNQAQQTKELPGARWMATLTYPALDREEIRKMKAFLAKLRGAAGRFYLWDFSAETPLGVATGSPLSNGVNQTGASLITDGWTPSISGILKEGDLVGINGELKIITEDIDSDAAGYATLIFEPPLRAAVPDNTPIITSQPTAVFRLVDDNQDKLQVQAGLNSPFTLNAIEMFS